MTKERALDVISICRCRHEAGSNCYDCIYYGNECIDAHEYAFNAMSVLTKKEVFNGNTDKPETGSRIFNRLS